MFDRDTADNIEKINAFFGMEHRSTPYDLTNSDDLKQALLLTVAAYADYWHYWMTLENVSENFDESLEYYDTATWINMGLDANKADNLAIETIRSINTAADHFRELNDRAQKNCTVILKAILAAPSATQQEVLGATYDVAPEESDEKIDSLFDAIVETGIPYHYQMEENRDEFLAFMKSKWASA